MPAPTFRALVFLLAALLLGGPALAQDATAPAAVASAPAPIAVSDVVAQAEDATSTLREIAANASPDPTAEAVEKRLPALTQEINARLQETAKAVEGSTSLETLRTFEADWRTLTADLPPWRAFLTARARKLEDDRARLDALAERWRQTREQLPAAGTPPEVRARIEGILRTAGETRRAITAEQARVVALQARVAEQHVRVDEAIKTIAVRRQALVGQLLVQDAPPLWSATLWAQAGAGQSIRDSLAAQSEGLAAFAERNADRLAVHGVVFALLAGALLYLRRWAEPVVEADPSLDQAATIFRLPIATALVLAILFASRVYPQTPQVLGAIFGAIAIVPTVVILRRLFAPTLYPLLYSIVVFFFVDQLRVVTEGAPSVGRPLFLAQMLAGALFFAWFRQARLRRIEPADAEKLGHVLRIVRFGSLAVIPFFVVSLAANALGYVNLARLVGEGVLRSLYAAVVLYVVFRIVDAVVAFALRFRPLSLLRMARAHAPSIRAWVRKLVLGAAVVVWCLSALEFFSLRLAALRELHAILTAKLALGSLAVSAGDVLSFFLVVWIAFGVSRFVRFVLEEDVFPRVSLARGVPYAISTIVNYAVLLLGFFFAVSAAGLDLTRVTVLVGAFGVGIGFGLQNIFNNFISGLILLFERPIDIGDEVRIGDAGGTVRRIGIRASRIRQWDGSEVIVPNSRLISENVKNWSVSSRNRGIEVPVSVDQSVDTRRVVAILTGVAAAHPLVAAEPPPQVLLGEVSAPPTLNYRLRAWTAETGKASRIASDLALAIGEALGRKAEATPEAGPPLTAPGSSAA
jgi:potassium efflux system protein